MNAEPFWSVDPRGKIEIDEFNLVLFLAELGFAYYSPTINYTAEPQILNIDGNIIEPIIPYWIHKEVTARLSDYTKDRDYIPDEIRSRLVTEVIRSRALIKKEVIGCLPKMDKEILADTKDKAYFIFKDKAVSVTNEGIDTIEIDKLDKYVWKSQIIDKDFNLRPMDEVKERSEYYQFLRNITSTKSQDKWEVNQERLDNLMTLQGYLLHGYKDRANAKAVALMDASEIGEPNGRTGKGLFVNGLSKLKKTVLEDGKSFKDDNRFRFSQVTSDTKILFINDIKENFNFENFFPTITDGITIEAKFENKKTIRFEESPKIVISTNYAILGKGSSFEDRIYEFELSNYYSKDHRPINDFKHLLFDEWDSDQWDLFYSLMLYSVQEYLNKGVVMSEGINLNLNKLISETSKHFIEWVSMFNLKPDIKYDKKELYKDFCDFVGVSPLLMEIPRLTITKYLKIWAHYNNLIPVEGHSNVERTIEFKSK
jgi:hypothetical protein